MQDEHLRAIERAMTESNRALSRLAEMWQDQQEINAVSTAIIDIMLRALIVVNQSGTIVRTNIESERLFGYPAEEMVGQEIEMLLPQDVRAAHKAHFASFIGQPRVREMGTGIDIKGQHKDGSTMQLDVRLAPVPTGKGIYTAALIRPL